MFLCVCIIFYYYPIDRGDGESDEEEEEEPIPDPKKHNNTDEVTCSLSCSRYCSLSLSMHIFDVSLCFRVLRTVRWMLQRRCPRWSTTLNQSNSNPLRQQPVSTDTFHITACYYTAYSSMAGTAKLCWPIRSLDRIIHFWTIPLSVFLERNKYFEMSSFVETKGMDTMKNSPIEFVEYPSTAKDID